MAEVNLLGNLQKERESRNTWRYIAYLLIGLVALLCLLLIIVFIIWHAERLTTIQERAMIRMANLQELIKLKVNNRLEKIVNKLYSNDTGG